MLILRALCALAITLSCAFAQTTDTSVRKLARLATNPNCAVAGETYYNTTNSALAVCTSPGTPGTWLSIANLNTLDGDVSSLQIEDKAVTGAKMSSATNAQSGTTYTILDADRGRLVPLTNAGTKAITLPEAGAGSLFILGWFTDIQNVGAGTATITTTTSTIDGSSSPLALTQGQGVRIWSDGTNYYTQRGVGGGSSSLPSQSGNGGKVLGTDGSSAAWRAAPVTVTGEGMSDDGSGNITFTLPARTYTTDAGGTAGSAATIDDSAAAQTNPIKVVADVGSLPPTCTANKSMALVSGLSSPLRVCNSAGTGWITPTGSGSGLAVSGATGLIVETSPGVTSAVTIAGANGVSVTDGDGLSGPPTISIPGSAKGDVLVRDASAVTRLAVGTKKGMSLTPDTAETTGLKWVPNTYTIASGVVGPSANTTSTTDHVTITIPKELLNSAGDSLRCNTIVAKTGTVGVLVHGWVVNGGTAMTITTSTAALLGTSSTLQFITFDATNQLAAFSAAPFAGTSTGVGQPVTLNTGTTDLVIKLRAYLGSASDSFSLAYTCTVSRGTN